MLLPPLFVLVVEKQGVHRDERLAVVDVRQLDVRRPFTSPHNL